MYLWFQNIFLLEYRFLILCFIAWELLLYHKCESHHRMNAVSTFFLINGWLSNVFFTLWLPIKIIYYYRLQLKMHQMFKVSSASWTKSLFRPRFLHFMSTAASHFASQTLNIMMEVCNRLICCWTCSFQGVFVLQLQGLCQMTPTPNANARMAQKH